ncbi:MAG: SocA family protein [Alphaproteobacteria bacterium]|nr:SocA family protein [Alphaproteobacteria bacterium]
MSSVFDAAKFILKETNAITAMKLQKLCYYAQAWSLVWDDAPLFNDKIEAWANGPVIPTLYDQHRGQYAISDLNCGDENNLTPEQKETIKKVIEFYGNYNSQQLSDLTHEEMPWKSARKKIPDGVRSSNEIPLASMAEYYASL